MKLVEVFAVMGLLILLMFIAIKFDKKKEVKEFSGKKMNLKTICHEGFLYNEKAELILIEKNDKPEKINCL